MVKNTKKILIFDLMAQKERLDALNTTQNNADPCKLPFLKNSRITAKYTIFSKIQIF